MSMNPLTKQQLTAIAFERIRNFGPVDDEVARDHGINTVDDMPAVISDALENQKQWGTDAGKTEKETKEELASVVGALMCGDCLVELGPGQSCGHVRVDLNGNHKILG